MSEKISLVFYQDMEHSWGRDRCIECCTRKGKNRVARSKAVVFKFRGIRRGMVGGCCPLCLGDENVKDMSLSYPETGK